MMQTWQHRIAVRSCLAVMCMCVVRDMAMAGDVESMVHCMLHYFFDGVMAVVQVYRQFLTILTISTLQYTFHSTECVVYCESIKQGCSLGLERLGRGGLETFLGTSRSRLCIEDITSRSRVS